MQYYLAIKAQIVVPVVSYRRFVQKRNLDVKRQWVTVPCITSKYSKNVSYINVYSRYNPPKRNQKPNKMSEFTEIKKCKRPCCDSLCKELSRVLLSDDTVNWLNRLAESRGLSIKVYLNEVNM